jgi:hypothetical protein
MGAYAGPANAWSNRTDSNRIDASTKVVVQSGLVLNLDAGASTSYPGSGTTWTDLSGNGNTGTLTNGPTYNSSNGGSIVFDGVDDYVSFSYNSSYNIGGRNLTLSSWVMATSLVNISHGGGIVVRDSGSNDGLYEMLLVNTSSKNWIFFRMSGISSYSPKIIPIELNTFYNITCVYDNGTMRNYVNGVQEGSGSSQNIDINTSGTRTLRIGRRFLDVAEFPGRIPQVSVYNRALTATEISQNYNATRSRFSI